MANKREKTNVVVKGDNGKTTVDGKSTADWARERFEAERAYAAKREAQGIEDPTAVPYAERKRRQAEKLAGNKGEPATKDVTNNKQGAFDGYLKALKAQNESAYKARVAEIENNVKLSVAEQEQAKIQAQNEHQANLENINQGVFDETKRGELSSQRRGIASSQQAEALSQGIGRTGIKMRFKNDQDRTQRLSSLTDRIAQIRQTGQSQIAQAGFQRDAANQAATVAGFQRQFQLEDQEAAREFQTSEREASQDYQSSEKEADREFQMGQQEQAFEQQLILKDKDLAADLEKIDVQFKNNMYAAAQQNQWNMDRDAVNNMAALQRLNVSNANSILMMRLQQKYDLQMDDLNFKQQKKLIDMDNEAKEDFAKLDEESRKRIMDYSGEKDKEMMQWQSMFNLQMSQIMEFGSLTKQDIVDQIDADVNKMADEYKKDWLGLRWYTPEDLETMKTAEINKAFKAKRGEMKDMLDAMGFGSFAEQKRAYDKLK